MADFAELGKLRAGLALFLFAAFLLILWQAQGATGFSQIGFASLLISPLVVWWLRCIQRGSPAPWLLSAHGLGLSFVWTAVLLPPILWSLEVTTPWDDVDWATSNYIFFVAMLLSSMLTFGVHVGMRRTKVPIARTGPSLLGYDATVAIVISALAGTASVVLLHVSAGGIGSLLANQTERRDILIGTGLSFTLAVIGGLGPLAALTFRSRGVLMAALSAIGGGSYVLYNFAQGSRFSLVAYAAALAIGYMRVRRVKVWPMLLLGLATVPFSVWYAQRVRHGIEGPLLKGSGLREELHSLVHPFVFGGLDTLRTLGATLNRDYALTSADLGAIGRGLGTVVPRAIWPGKPDGYSSEFSATYFPLRWSQGTGVPPSFFAEAVAQAGLIGAMLLALALGFALSRLSLYYWSRYTPLILLWGPLLMTDIVVLLKSGSDSFLRLAIMQFVAVLILVACLSRTDSPLREERPQNARR